MEQAIVVSNQNFLAPVVDVQGALQRYQDVKDFVSGVLREEVDFGVIPGTNKKNTLLKPGAEKLAAFFGLTTSFDLVSMVEDWTGAEHDGEAFFYYRYKCQLHRNGQLVAEGEGSCNSWEKKYRWRNPARKCPKCGNETIIKGKDQYGGGWLCWKKKGGCGATFKDGDQSIEGQSISQVANPDIADIVNTLQKMAQKRAFIAPVLIATNASEYFTQDVEDFIDADFTVKEEPAKSKPVKQASKPVAKPVAKPAEETVKPLRLTPDKLKEAIENKAAGYKGSNPPQTTIGVVVANLEKCFAGSDAKNKRHEFLNWLTGHASIKDVDGAVVLALKDWLKATQDDGGDWMPCDDAIREANAAVEKYERDNGQQSILEELGVV